jgi:hypothetical protein
MLMQTGIMKVQRLAAFLQQLQAALRFAEASGHKDCVAWPCAAAQDGAAAPALANYSYIDKNVGATRGIAACDWTTQLPRSYAQAL